MKSGTLMKPGAVATEVEAKAFDLETLYALVECETVEHVRVGKHSLWIDEEGKLKRLPINGTATAITDALRAIGNDVIVGTALLTPAWGTHAKACAVCALPVGG